MFHKTKLKNTDRKVFGGYFHNILGHAPDQLRIVSGRSANAEKEDAIFHSIKTDSKQASNHHPDNILTNALIRLQARNQINSQFSTQTSQESGISEIYKPLSLTLTNSLISFHWIENYPREYQCLLER